PVRQEPAADQRLGDPRALLARRGRGEIAQPGEALELCGQRTGSPDLCEIEVLERDCLATDGEAAGQKRLPALAVAGDMVARHGDELQRLLRPLEAREQRSARELLDDLALGDRAVGAHPRPLSALMLPA